MNIASRISPVVRSIRYLPGEDVLIGIPRKANYTLQVQIPETCELAAGAVEKLKNRLAGLFYACPDAADGPVVIALSLDDAPADMKNADQGYKILIENEKVDLIGYGEAGLYYAVTTFLQCLVMEKGEAVLPAVEIVDYPDLKSRGHFMETRYGSNLMELEDWKKVVDHMEEMKQNHLTVSVYGCWCVQYDYKVSEYLYVPIKKYPKLKTPVYGKYYSPKKGEWVNFEKLPPMVEKDYLSELIAYGKTKGVEVLPMFNSFGHNTLIPNQYPEVSAKDENGEPTRTGFCTSNPKTYEMMFDIYDEIIDRYLIPNGITSFDVGLDEVHDGIAQNAEDIKRIRSPWCKCPECAKKQKFELFIAHAVKLVEHLKKRGMKTVYMYCDMLCNKKWGLGDAVDNTQKMMEAMREKDLLDVVCFDWWSYAELPTPMMFDTTRPELGIRRSVKPWNGYYHWSVVTHRLTNSYRHAKIAYEESAEAMRSYSAWDRSYDRTHRLQADFAWNFAGAGTVEDAKDRYVRLNFPKRYLEGKRAMDLMDMAMKNNTITNEGCTDPVPSRSSLLLSWLAYYPYSYVAADKPYPRVYPGEAFSRIAGKDEILSEIREIAALSREASAIFDSLSKDTSCNVEMAKRFHYETQHYMTLAEDYLAMVEMDKLAKSGCPCALKKIQEMAKERKEARLSLLLLLEETKEEFLLPSHMRNQTISMQYFADLEAYLANTPAEDVKLDFTDNTHFASAAFWNLR